MLHSASWPPFNPLSLPDPLLTHPQSRSRFLFGASARPPPHPPCLYLESAFSRKPCNPGLYSNGILVRLSGPACLKPQAPPYLLNVFFPLFPVFFFSIENHFPSTLLDITVSPTGRIMWWLRCRYALGPCIWVQGQAVLLVKMCYCVTSQDEISLLSIFLIYKMGILIVHTSSGHRLSICTVLRMVLDHRKCSMVD